MSPRAPRRSAPGRPGLLRAVAAAAAGLALLVGCAGSGGGGSGGGSGQGDAAKRGGAGGEASPSRTASPTTGLDRIPGVGDRLRSRIPARARQVLVAYGRGEDDTRTTVVLWTRNGTTWDRTRSWAGHNGKRGWTAHHRENDRRSPVGVFTLSDAGGVLPDPDRDPRAGLPYDRSQSFAAPRHWPRTHWHDFDYVIAIDYNRVKGTSPNDPTRPQGRSRGGSIWLHLDHGSGTSGCVSLPEAGMEYLLRHLEPARHPVIVMGDKASLGA
ncbi:L,D-transpeptidase family protein [Streptomyces pathocidini]|uniref:L,D-transpeptidase family protein n=1 Tax=Streptomyces pathocidini TaxID=1650571 RepID=A0ABW7UL63_9ACTN|nr:L,D-transpeptidase family protein [Streptomyces pathocidini]